MKIPLNFDVESKPAPSYSKGTSFENNPQVEPYEKPIPESSDMKANNSTEPDTINKGQPYKKTGSGYCG
jgi:hypothetical protein